MNNPFKEGDVVYHPTAGKGKVTTIDERLVYFVTEGGEKVCATSDICSFDPWPKPNHTRPFEPTLKEGQRVIAISSGDSSKQYYGFVSKEDKDKVTLKNLGKSNTFAKSSYFFYAEVIL